MNDLLAAALEYAAKGWRVLPLHWPTADGCSCGQDCGHNGKHPLIRNWKKRATTNAQTIRAWWQRWPNANVGIATGEASGLLVLDIDGTAGAASIEQAGGCPDTIRARTGNGMHCYFTHPAGQLPNAVRFAPGLDVRAEGGMIVAPPSLHASGRRYSWLSDPDAPLAPPPDWLLAAIDRAEQPLGDSPSQGGGTAAYARAALHGEIAQLTRSSPGERNNQLNRSAFNLGTLVQEGLLDADVVEAALEQAAWGIGLGEDEIHATIRSGLEAGQRKAVTSPRRIAQDAAPAVEKADNEIDLNSFNRSDAGNAECLIARYGDRLRYCHTRKKWLFWSGARWEIDEDGQAQRTALAIARRRYHAATTIQSLEERKAAARWAIASESAAKIEAALRVASFQFAIATTIEQYDSDPWLAASSSATLDLRSGTHRAPRREDYLTMALGTQFDSAASCPRWETFLEEIFNHDQELIRYVQRAIGYTLTGDTSEQCLFLCHGSGANGKSVFLDVLSNLFGDYAGSTSFDTFDAGNRTTATNDLAALKGKRFVSIIETEEDRRLDEARVKQVTGQDLVDCRFLYGEWFSYKPSYKLWMAMNHLPTIRGTDRGIWRRIRLIPFVQNFEQSPDRRLREKLLLELPGILNWALAGLQDWLAEGLGSCPAVANATERYRAESDQIERWLEDCCVHDPDATCSVSEAFQSYTRWCEDVNERPLSQNMWGRRLSEKGFERTRREGGRRFYSGLGLRPADLVGDTIDTFDAFCESPSCKNGIPKSYDQCVNCVNCVTTNDDPPAPPPGTDHMNNAIQQQAQRMVESALAKAARVLADPRQPAEKARYFAREVPRAHYAETLSRIEEMIAVRREEGEAV